MTDLFLRRSTSNLSDVIDGTTVVCAWKHIHSHWLQQTSDINDALFENSAFHSVLHENDFELEIATRSEDDDNDDKQYFILRIINRNGKVFEEEHQIDKFNYYIEDPVSKNVGITIVQNIDLNFRSFNILRLGPNPNNAINEYFQLDKNNRLHVIVYSTDPNTNEVTKLLRSFEKKVIYQRPSPKITFKNIQKTSGWNYLLFFHPYILSFLQIELYAIEESQSKQIFWSLNQSNGKRSMVNNNTNIFPVERSLISNITFTFQITIDDKIWLCTRELSDVQIFLQFCIKQLSTPSIPSQPSSSPCDLLTRLTAAQTLLPKAWKTKNGFNEYVIALQTFLQSLHSTNTNTNTNTNDDKNGNVTQICMEFIACFFEIPEHLTKAIINYWEQQLHINLSEEYFYEDNNTSSDKKKEGLIIPTPYHSYFLDSKTILSLNQLFLQSTDNLLPPNNNGMYGGGGSHMNSASGSFFMPGPGVNSPAGYQIEASTFMKSMFSVSDGGELDHTYGVPMIQTEYSYPLPSPVLSPPLGNHRNSMRGIASQERMPFFPNNNNNNNNSSVHNMSMSSMNGYNNNNGNGNNSPLPPLSPPLPSPNMNMMKPNTNYNTNNNNNSNNTPPTSLPPTPPLSPLPSGTTTTTTNTFSIAEEQLPSPSPIIEILPAEEEEQQSGPSTTATVGTIATAAFTPDTTNKNSNTPMSNNSNYSNNNNSRPMSIQNRAWNSPGFHPVPTNHLLQHHRVAYDATQPSPLLLRRTNLSSPSNNNNSINGGPKFMFDPNNQDGSVNGMGEYMQPLPEEGGGGYDQQQQPEGVPPSRSADIGYDVYTAPPTNIRFLPLELVTTPTMKKSIAKGLLYNILHNTKGMIVLKYGRQGHPKRRIITCDSQVNCLYYFPETINLSTIITDDNLLIQKNNKPIVISDIIRIQEGLDIDPDTSEEVLQTASNLGIISAVKLTNVLALKHANNQIVENNNVSMKSSKTSSSLFGLFSGTSMKTHQKADQNGILYGTSTLRKHCKLEDLPLCLSLILPDRSFDIQCYSKADYELLLINLRELIPSANNNNAHNGENGGLAGTNPLARGGTNFSPSNSLNRKSMNMNNNANAGNKSRYLEGITPEYKPDSPLPSQKLFPTDAITTPIDDNDNNSSKKSPKLLHPTMSGILKDHTASASPPPQPLVTKKSVRFFAEPEEEAEAIQSNGEGLVGNMSALTMDDSFEHSTPTDTTTATSHNTSSLGLLTKDEVYQDDNLDNLIQRRDIVLTDSNGGIRISKSLSVSFDSLSEDQHRHNRTKPAMMNSSFHMTSTEVIHIGLILSEQERMYGTNMYESLQSGDEKTIQYYNTQGFTTEEAILKIFEDRYVHRKPIEIIQQEQEHAAKWRAASIDAQDPAIMNEDPVRMQSPLIPNLVDILTKQGVENNNQTVLQSTSTSSKAPLNRLKSSDALQLGLLLSQQETEYGINMYESLQPEDEQEMERLVRSQQITPKEAILEIFNKKLNLSENPLAEITKLKASTDEMKSGALSPKASMLSIRSDSKDLSEAGMEIPALLKSRSLSELNSQRHTSTLFPNATNAVSSPTAYTFPDMTIGRPKRLNSMEAMQLAMILSEQDTMYGTNMYDSLTPQDESEVYRLVNQGMMGMEDAIFEIFKRKYIDKTSQQQQQNMLSPYPIPLSNYNTPPPPQPISMHQYQQQQMMQQQGAYPSMMNMSMYGGMMQQPGMQQGMMMQQQQQQQQQSPSGSGSSSGMPEIPHIAIPSQQQQQQQQRMMSSMGSMASMSSMSPTSAYSPYNNNPNNPNNGGMMMSPYGYPPQGGPPNPNMMYYSPPNPNGGPGGYPPQGYPSPYPPPYGNHPPPPYGYHPYPPQHHPNRPPPGYYPYPPPQQQQGGQGQGMYGQGPGGYASPRQYQSQPPPSAIPIVTPQPVSGNSSASSSRGNGPIVVMATAASPPLPSQQRAPPLGQTRRGNSTTNANAYGNAPNTRPAAPAPVPVAAAPIVGSPPTSPQLRRLNNTNNNKSFFGSFFQRAGSIGGNGNLRCKESDVRTIMNMGFTRDQAVWALLQNDHNVVMAVNSLT